MNIIIKTVDWADCSDAFIIQAQKTFGALQGREPIHFLELLQEYPCASTKAFQELFQNVVMYSDFPNVTAKAVSIENACLFYAENDGATALEIVLSHLGIINQQKHFPSLWCFLDDEEKAVVHFVNRNGFYAELYCSGSEDTSFLHMIETPNGIEFIPMLCVTDLSAYAHQAKMRGSKRLREYLPRESGSLLSKGGYKSVVATTPSKLSEKQRKSDDGDTL